MDFFLTLTILSYGCLFTFSEEFAAVVVFACDVFETGFYEFYCFADVVGDFACEVVVGVFE